MFERVELNGVEYDAVLSWDESGFQIEELRYKSEPIFDPEIITAAFDSLMAREQEVWENISVYESEESERRELCGSEW